MNQLSNINASLEQLLADAAPVELSCATCETDQDGSGASVPVEAGWTPYSGCGPTTWVCPDCAEVLSTAS